MEKNKDIIEYWKLVKKKAPAYLSKRMKMRGTKVWPNDTKILDDKILPVMLNRLNTDSSGRPHLLDVGCGYGIYSFYFAETSFKVTGVDFCQDAINAANRFKKEAYPDTQAKFFCKDIMDFGVSELESSFDVVMLYKFIHQWRPSELDALKDKIISLLSPGGLIFINTMDVTHDLYGKGVEIEENVYDSRGYRPCHFFSLHRLKESFLRNMSVHFAEVVREPEQVYEEKPDLKYIPKHLKASHFQRSNTQAGLCNPLY